MSHKSPCYICNEQVSYSAKHKHFFSKRHEQHVIDAVIRRKGQFIKWLDDIKGVIPSVEFHKKNYKVCFSCKVVVPMTKEYRCCPCGKNDENANAIKEILNSQSESSLTQSEETSVSQEELNVTNKKLENANKEIKALKNHIETLENVAEGYDTLYYILDKVKGENSDMFNSVLSLLKGSCYSNTYSKLKEDLHIDE